MDSARYMLSALIQGEFAVVALIVTLSLIAVQLAASSYSARVIEAFRKTPDIWILIVIYGFAIFYGLGVLKLIQKVNPQVCAEEFICISNLENGISLSYYLGLFAFSALILYIWNTLDILKPSNVIKILAEEITKKNILDCKNYYKYKFHHLFYKTPIKMKTDPIQPIVDIVLKSLMIYDDATAKDGLRAIGNHINTIFKYEKFERDEAIRLSGHYSAHLISVGKLTIRLQSIESLKEVITSFNRIGLTLAKLRYSHATEIITDSLKDLGIKMIETKFDDELCEIESSLGCIGEQAALFELEDVVTKVANHLESIGKIAVEKELKTAPMKAVYALGNVVKKSALLQDNLISDIIRSLNELGIVAIKHEHDNVTIEVIIFLKEYVLVEMHPKCLFSWFNSLGEESDTLRFFLEHDLAVDWVKQAEIQIQNENINVFFMNEFVKITLDKNGKEANLYLSDGRFYDLQVKEKNGKLNVYKNYYETRIIMTLIFLGDLGKEVRNFHIKQIAIRALEKIGIEAVKLFFNEITDETASSLKSIGEEMPKENSVISVYLSLENIGIAAVEQAARNKNFIGTISKVARALRDVEKADLVRKQGNGVAATGCNLRNLGEETVKQGLEETTKDIIECLEEVAITAKRQNSLSSVMDVIKEIEYIQRKAIKLNQIKVSEAAEVSLQKIIPQKA